MPFPHRSSFSYSDQTPYFSIRYTNTKFAHLFNFFSLLSCMANLCCNNIKHQNILGKKYSDGWIHFKFTDTNLKRIFNSARWSCNICLVNSFSYCQGGLFYFSLLKSLSVFPNPLSWRWADSTGTLFIKKIHVRIARNSPVSWSCTCIFWIPSCCSGSLLFALWMELSVCTALFTIFAKL